MNSILNPFVCAVQAFRRGVRLLQAGRRLHQERQAAGQPGVLPDDKVRTYDHGITSLIYDVTAGPFHPADESPVVPSPVAGERLCRGSLERLNSGHIAFKKMTFWSI